VTEHNHVLRKYRRSKQFKQKPHYSNCVKVMTIFCSYVLWERESLLIMQLQYKTCKFAGCVKVNRKFQYKTRYWNQQVVKYCRTEQGGFND